MDISVLLLLRKPARQAGSSEVGLLRLRFAEITAVVHHVRPEAELAAQGPPRGPAN